MRQEWRKPAQQPQCGVLNGREGFQEVSRLILLDIRTSILMTSKGSGTLLPGTIARILKPDGSLADYDEPGELVIYSQSNALCYLNNQEA